MITILEYKENKVEECNLSDVSKGKCNEILSPKVFGWIDVFAPDATELNTVSEITGMPIDDLKMAIDEEERPKIIELGGPFSLIIVGAPSFGVHEIKTTPVYIYISKQYNFVVTIRHKDTKSISRLKQSVEAKKNFFASGASYFVYRLVDEIITTYFDVLEDVELKIDKIEDTIINTPEIKLVEKIFDIKKTLIYFTKTLSANREAINSIEKEYLSEIDKKRARQFRTLYNDTVQLIDMATAYREILTNTLDIYISSVSANLNRIMKTLTVGATLVMIPTLIASMYGMNFKYMPELGWKYGYYFSIGLMIVSVIIIYIYFKMKGWVGQPRLKGNNHNHDK